MRDGRFGNETDNADKFSGSITALHAINVRCDRYFAMVMPVHRVGSVALACHETDNESGNRTKTIFPYLYIKRTEIRR